MNKKLLYLLLALVLVCSVALTACNLTPTKVTITYKYNYDGAPADKTVNLDQGANLALETPSREGYTFEGWFTDAACTKAFTDKTANANVTLYAKWKQNEAPHTHDLQYKSSSSKHWQECSCGYTTEQVDHTFDANNTCVCGYKQGGTAHTHSWATDWSKDATNHWHVCTGCSELNDKAAHDTNGTDGACSVCGYKAQAQGETVTVYFYTTEWTAVYAYAWVDGSNAEVLGTWPGTAINAVAGEEGWYSVEVSAEAQNIIFNNNAGAQTADLLVANGPYFYKNNGYATKEEAEAAMSIPEVKTTLYYYTTAWTTVYAYTWQPESLGAWTGTALTAVEGDAGWFTIDVPSETVNILFNNGEGAQTSDLLVANGPYFVGNTGYATKEEAEAAISAPVVTTYSLKGSFDTWGAGVAFEAHTDTEVKLLNVALEANAEFKVVISVTGQNDEWINTLKDGVTVATVAENTNITVAEAGNYNLFFDITTKQLWIEKVVEEHEHVASETYSSDATGHWYACTTCSAVIEGSFAEHDTEGEEGACSVCGWVTPVEPEKVTLYYYNNLGWEEVYGYSWTPVSLGEYPGTKLAAIEDDSNWYSVEMDPTVAGFQFNNGKSGDEERKTIDLTLEDGKTYYYAGTWYATQAEAEEAFGQEPVTTITLRGSWSTDWSEHVAFEAHNDNEVKIVNFEMAAGTEFKVVISVTGQEDEWINILKDGVTVATHAANGNITVAEAGSYNLYFDITTKQLWIEKAVVEHEHVASETYSSDATGHWYACTTCSAVIEGTKGDHDTNGTDGACSVCGWVTPAEPEKVTLYYYTTAWTTVYAYTWEPESLGVWTGTPLTAVEGEEGWFSIEVLADTVNILFNNGNGLQTVNLLVADGPYFFGISGAAKTMEEANESISKPAEEVTLYYYTTEWTAVYAYTWTPEALGTWPGTALTPVEGETGWFTIGVPAETVNIIFNIGDDSAKTSDLLVADGPYFVGNAGYVTKEEAEASLSAPETWTVAGTAGLCGTEWDTTNADNDMTYDSEKEAWVKTYTGIAAGEHKFKVVKNHMWDEAYPAEDYVLNVASDDATVTIVLKGKEVTVEVIEKEHEHVASETYSSDATGHWYACTTCSAVIEGSFAEHDTEGEEGACSVCGYTKPVEPEKVTVCFQNNWLWTEVKAYYWVGEEDKVFNAEWPGVDMTFVENDGSYDIYSIEVPVNVTGLIISGIKDDGSGVRDQSPDITTGLEDGVLFRMAWNDGNQVEVVCTKHIESLSYSSDALNHWLTCVNCTAVLQDTIAAHDTDGENGVCSVCGFDPSQVVEATVLYLTPNANWKKDGARFAAYFFGNGEAWVDMTDEDGDGIYEVVVPEGFVNIIFCRMNPSAATNNWNNKWNQTADLKVPTDGTNMFTVKEGTWDKGGGTWSVLPVAAE